MILQTTSFTKKLLAVFLVFAALYFAKAFLVPVAIAGVVATLLLPFCRAMEKRGLPKVIAILICLLAIITIVAAVALLLGWQVAELSSDFTLIRQRIIETGLRLRERISTYSGISVERQSQLLTDRPTWISSIIQTAAGSFLESMTGFIFVMGYIFFLLYYRRHLKTFLLQLMPVPQREEMEQVLNKASEVSQQYLLGLIKMIALLWIMYGIGFSLLGVRNALFFAFLCGLLEIVPYIGNITGTTLTILVAAVHGAGLPVLAGIAGIYGGIQFIQGWILEPLILGPQVRINSLFTIIALVIGGMLWGTAGIFLAIPLTAMLKIVFDHIEALKPYGFLIGEVEKEEKKK